MAKNSGGALPKPGKPTNPKNRVGGEKIPYNEGKSGTRIIPPKKK